MECPPGLPRSPLVTLDFWEQEWATDSVAWMLEGTPVEEGYAMPLTETWHKSSYSANGSHCVEVREYVRGADVRDTQNRDLGKLDFSAEEWVALQSCLRAG